MSAFSPVKMSFDVAYIYIYMFNMQRWQIDMSHFMLMAVETNIKSFDLNELLWMFFGLLTVPRRQAR